MYKILVKMARVTHISRMDKPNTSKNPDNPKSENRLRWVQDTVDERSVDIKITDRINSFFHELVDTFRRMMSQLFK
jgi:hypothetical protein